MGGIGSHHVHSYAFAVAALFLSMLFPLAVLALLGGAIHERRRRHTGRPSAEPANAPLATGRLASLGD
jgi:hypothetical protein